MVWNQPYLIINNKTSLYLTRKIPGSIRLGIIQPHFQELSQETLRKDVWWYMLSVLMALALLSQFRFNLVSCLILWLAHN